MRIAHPPSDLILNVSIGNAESAFWNPGDIVVELPDNSTWKTVAKHLKIKLGCHGHIPNGWHEISFPNGTLFLWKDINGTDLKMDLRTHRSKILKALKDSLSGPSSPRRPGAQPR